MKEMRAEGGRMDKIRAATLEVEIARRQTLRNFRNIKNAIQDCLEEAENSENYSKKQAIEALRYIDYEVEKQTAQWLWGNQSLDEWTEV
ncbi:MAG: hypothetical protein MJZ10_14240 [Fibrobacter sp.]|nr:hypothetical protein [Fibrobacter sp.]